jgi:hypothetical protein
LAFMVFVTCSCVLNVFTTNRLSVPVYPNTFIDLVFITIFLVMIETKKGLPVELCCRGKTFTWVILTKDYVIRCGSKAQASTSASCKYTGGGYYVY